jgi:hypothetical protein
MGDAALACAQPSRRQLARVCATIFPPPPPPPAANRRRYTGAKRASARACDRVNEQTDE